MKNFGVRKQMNDLKNFFLSSSQKIIFAFFDVPYINLQKIDENRQKARVATEKESFVLIQMEAQNRRSVLAPISGYILSINERNDTFLFKNLATKELSLFSFSYLHKIRILSEYHQKNQKRITG